ncbi:double zinc ribbon and ankyrin repeat-containing protein 1-like [Mercenaria mercenaria]|uniref:double zinc ribbon and ankyrin repeat-containing protein 1-like n=1 Tax=Mercenaria mercenaria TaxID=6596 RepID=UPI00234F844D|nr:double zinc ribbon and ankyrin repeat-containing protein 1-like [Mercenaria mercenaria]
MTAGSIAVPTIVPLRPPIPGKPKSSIDSNTKIELSTESNGARIYYTINGTKPDPFPKVSQTKYTMEYQGPFTLPAGKQTLKAVAVSADGMRESNVVTKVFEVDYVAQPALPPEGDDLEFRDDLEKEKTMVTVISKYFKINVKRAQKNLMMSSRSAWTDVSTARNMTNRMSGNENLKKSSPHKPEALELRPAVTATALTCSKCRANNHPYATFCGSRGVKIEAPYRVDEIVIVKKNPEHVCQHIKAHAQNDAEFRALIGEPKMGKLLTSTVQEDGYELSLTVTFALRGGKDKFAGKKLGITEDYLSFHTEQDNMTTYRTDSDDYEEIIEDSPKKSGKKIIKKKKPVKRASKQDQLLLKEVGPSGEGDPTEVQQLIDEGNTALHEAVNVGPANGKVVEALLNNGVNQNIKNDKGESPYDLAVKGGYENIVKKFAAALGQSQLDKMIRPKNKGY